MALKPMNEWMNICVACAEYRGLLTGIFYANNWTFDYHYLSFKYCVG